MHFSSVQQYCAKEGEYENAAAPSHSNPEVGTAWFLASECSDGIHDWGGGLVLSEPTDRSGHGGSGHEDRTDERQDA